VFDTCGEFRADLPTAEDVEWFTRVKDAGMPFAVLPDVLLRVRIHDANTSLNTGGSQAHLLSALKHSIARKRDQRQDPSG
jgi:hypothetical protein